MATVTCQTEGCGNADIPIELDLYYTDDETGERHHVGGVSCGVCGQPITDITHDEDTPPDENGGGS